MQYLQYNFYFKQYKDCTKEILMLYKYIFFTVMQNNNENLGMNVLNSYENNIKMETILKILQTSFIFFKQNII